MARSSGVVRTPDTGYKFTCQGCEDEVVQVATPLLIWRLSEEGRGKSAILVSEGLQVCTDCAIEVRKENEKISKKHQAPERQVVPLREGSELATVLPPEALAAVKEPESSQDMKDIKQSIADLTSLMAQFIATQIPKAEPVNAPSEAAKPKARAANNAKPKARRSK